MFCHYPSHRSFCSGVLYNRREKLIRLLKSIINSNYPKEKMEIVIIDDFSTDGTDEAVRKFIKDNESLKQKLEAKELILTYEGFKKFAMSDFKHVGLEEPLSK